ncbi:MAG: hypothetical protein IT437_11865 [Phycisphaerales bacterium]|nr:hypothetical protein [Phycisphaerales bacterium]
MMSLLERFVTMPPAVKGGLVLATGGGLVAAAGYFLGTPAMVALLLGIAILTLLLVGYRALLKALARRKSAPMEKAIASNSGAPLGVSDPARRASLDSMRKSFETGVEKFRAAGKNLYALPWYALVGESGSGKTEAIRHCNVGFPPGLQDQLQGVGGTINMNWWFTNEAIILDTAGRLMFEEVEPGSTSEWQEFLKLLKKNRPNCPINGMLLVIPAESLIRDTADQLEKKGGKIAQQLDNIQRALGVRFPVFVVITKCDLINGFREFFDTIKDPTLQHQILGWSNPADLDTPFNPELVEQHLRTVQHRLRRRRLGLLLDPVHTEDASARRADQVDALFDFPEAIMKIAPRLRRYLEMIFVAGTWSAKPLFLRGIYFTSSMREGSALDADLAEALGRPVESLPEGRIWERDRAFFLRDLFKEKVFKEKGLVTRASNTRQQQRKRRAVLMGTAAGGLLLVLVFTWFGWRKLQTNILEPHDFWEQTSAAYPLPRNADEPRYRLPIVFTDPTRGLTYRNTFDSSLHDGIKVPTTEPKVAGRFPAEVARQAARPIKVPLIFYPVNLLSGTVSGDFLPQERRAAARALVGASVIRPLLDAARARMAEDVKAPGTWSAEASGALRQLVRVQVDALENNPTAAPIDVDPLLLYTLGREQYTKPPMENGQVVPGYDNAPAPAPIADRESLQSAVNSVYQGQSGDGWARQLADTGDLALIQSGVEAFKKGWAGGSGDALGTLTAMIRELEALEKAEARLQEVDSNPDPRQAIDVWNKAYAEVSAHAAEVAKGLPELRGRSLAEAYTKEREARRTELRTGLLAELAPVTPPESGKPPPVAASSDAGDKARWDTLARARDSLGELLQDNKEEQDRASQLTRLDALFLGGGEGRDHQFQSRLALYQRADGVLNPAATPPASAFGAVRREMRSLDDAIAEAVRFVTVPAAAGTPGAGPAADATSLRLGASRVSKFALGLAGSTRRAALIGEFLLRAPKSAQEFADAVDGYAAENKLSLDRPRVPMSAKQDEAVFDPHFNPAAAAAVLGDAAAVAGALGSNSPEVTVLDAKPLEARFGPVKAAADKYAADYLYYWSSGRNEDLRVVDAPWGDFYARLRVCNQPDDFNAPLTEEAKIIVAAMDAVEAFIPAAEGVSPASVRKDAQDAQRLLAGKSDTYRHVLSNWRALPGDAAQARNQLLGSLKTFDTEYIVHLAPDQPGLGDFVTRFWENLAFQGLRAVARDPANDTAQAVRTLQAGALFPLAPVENGKPQMSAADVLDKQKIIERVRPPAASDAAPRISDRFDPEIARLRGSGALTPEQAKWLERAARLLAALPQNPNESYSCVITMLQEAPKGAAGHALAGQYYEYVGLRQGDGEPHREYLRGEPRVLGSVTYPGPPLKISIFDSAEAGSAPRAGTGVEVQGPWAALALLQQYQALTADGKTWNVEVLVPGSAPGTQVSIWVQMEFKNGLPPAAEWPR